MSEVKLDDLKPNSHRYRAEQQANADEKRVDKVIKGGAKTKKKSEATKLANMFISDDVSNVKEYLVMDVLIPTVKKAILTTIDMILNGGHTTYDTRSNGSRTSYSKFYDDRRDDRRSNNSYARTSLNFDDVIFDNRGDAEAVLRDMYRALDQYGIVRVADLYEMAGLRQPYTSNRYGWMSLRDADVVRVSDGYIIKLPRAVPID